MDCPVVLGRYELHFFCSNCLKNQSAFLDVPDIEDAPRDAEELAESALLQRVRFVCDQCEGTIGTLVGISRR